MLSPMTDANPNTPIPVRVARQGTGFVAEGPGFYVWDLDAETVARSACELAEAAATRRRLMERWVEASVRTAPCAASVSRLPVRRRR